MDIIRYTDNETCLIERNGTKEISGYGALFYTGEPGTEYPLGDNLFERIQPGAFDKCLASGKNVAITYNHSRDFVLGDTEHGAVVRCDNMGLRYSVPFDPQDPDHQKVASKIHKGLVKGSSFAATNPKYRFEQENGKDIAWITSVDVLRDCSVVNDPAYKAAPAMLRSEELDSQYKEWLRLKAETEKRLQKIAKSS
jgi:HK97 family phage prohead protease